MWGEEEVARCAAAAAARGSGDEQAQAQVCALEGVTPPALGGHFYAMSVYFYALDAIRHLGTREIPDWCVLRYLPYLTPCVLI
jgi:hypothetical protein